MQDISYYYYVVSFFLASSEKVKVGVKTVALDELWKLQSFFIFSGKFIKVATFRVLVYFFVLSFVLTQCFTLFWSMMDSLVPLSKMPRSTTSFSPLFSVKTNIISAPLISSFFSKFELNHCFIAFFLFDIEIRLSHRFLSCLMLKMATGFGFQFDCFLHHFDYCCGFPGRC